MKRGRRPKANPSKWGLYKRIKRREEKLAQRDPDEVTREIYQFGELVQRYHDRPHSKTSPARVGAGAKASDAKLARDVAETRGNQARAPAAFLSSALVSCGEKIWTN